MAEPVTTASDDRLLLTLEEAAQCLAVGRTTIYELVGRGELQTVTIGRCRRVPVSSLRSFVDQLVSRAAPAATAEAAPQAEAPADPAHRRRTIAGLLARGPVPTASAG
jgi:excisionase family DNA binding protein